MSSCATLADSLFVTCQPTMYRLKMSRMTYSVKYVPFVGPGSFVVSHDHT
jgi:hypothetical protein